MATSVPEPIKAADLGRFATRAAQLEKFKPVISYWCTLYIVENIIKRGLEKTNEECMLYTANLMDKLEAWKAQYHDNDTIHDDEAAQAFVEQFALETFERADKALRARKATLQTADTFQAARTFLDLMTIWPPANPEITAKSKYAKYHAVRIIKAIKAGEDPNLPEDAVPQPEPLASPPPLDPNDPEVMRLNSLQPSVEDVSDSSRPPSFSHNPTPPPITTPPPRSFSQPQHTGGDVSPLEPDPPSSDYFPPTLPQPPAFSAAPPSPGPPSVPSDAPPSLRSAPPPMSPSDASDFYKPQPPMPPPSIPSQTPPIHQAPPPIVPQMVPTFQSPAPSASAPASFVPAPAGDDPRQYIRSDEAIMAAQKHAKWAISALNFDDVDTAVLELRKALQQLGAR